MEKSSTLLMKWELAINQMNGGGSDNIKTQNYNLKIETTVIRVHLSSSAQHFSTIMNSPYANIIK